MSMTDPEKDPQAIRERIEELKTLLARADGEIEAHQAEEQKLLGELRSALKCRPGKEREAVAKLRKQIEADTAKVSTLLDQAEELLEVETL